MDYSAYLNTTFLGNEIKNYVLFALIIIAGLTFKRLVSRLLSKLLLKLFGKFGSSVNAEVFINLLIKPLEILILLTALYLSINQLDYPLDEVIFSRRDTHIKLIDVVDKVFLFFIIITLFWVLLRIIDFISHVFAYKASLTESKADDQVVSFLKELSKIITGIIGVFVIMGSVFDLNVATIIAGLGIGGIAIALAAKESLENLLGSFTIFMDRPFVVGDLIRVDSIEGTVEKVGFRSTKLRTTDKTIVTLPNKKMIDGALENMTLRNYRRVKFNIGLTYDTKPETLRKINNEISDYINQRELTNNDVTVIFESFGDWSLNLQVLYLVEMMDFNEYLKIREEINYKIMEIVQANGADFAYPTSKVIHHQTQDTEGDQGFTD
ncbi:mechanosensitive ion channel [Pedobacter sp. HMF7647]|uniref:Mechanosensitive ion channel n=1 Tax=Hufsiella arboris TaxID=2695275 RepID=A0A7K1Y5G9_9SPHI|nr:mechanosensitive ion channel family protein [Hufsiella arboris]MXV49835.1 mechanosensitive ion channel [Hufsiella arboris]